MWDFTVMEELVDSLIGNGTLYFDGFVKSREFQSVVIPAKAGIQFFQYILDAGSSPA